MGKEDCIEFSNFNNDFPLYIDNPKVEVEKFDIHRETSVDIDISLDRAFAFIRHYSKDLSWIDNIDSALISGTLYHGDTFGNYIIDAIDNHNNFTNNLFSLINDFNEELNLKFFFGILYGLRRKSPEDYLYFLERVIKNRKVFCLLTSFLNTLQKTCKVYILEEPLRSREKNLLSKRPKY